LQQRLNSSGKKTGLAYALGECNSMGLAMMQVASFEKAAERVQRENDITAIIMENDVYRYMPSSFADAFFSRCKNIIVLDSLNNATTEKANVLIPAATFAEADGTLVNYEGRAQRYYQVFVPSTGEIKESWKWLWKIQLAKMQTSNGHDPYPEELLQNLRRLYHNSVALQKCRPVMIIRFMVNVFPERRIVTADVRQCRPT
jgi:NADH-quinone oxidoreductase subunit G